MSTSSTQTRTPSRVKSSPSKSQGLSLDSIRQRLEDHVKAHPLKAMGQAMAAGYILRYLPIKALIATGLRIAGPLALLGRVWQGSASSDDTDVT